MVEDVKKALTVTWQDGTADDSWDGFGQMKAAEDGWSSGQTAEGMFPGQLNDQI